VLAKASIRARRSSSIRLLAFRRGVDLAAEVGSSRAGLREEAGEDWLNERSEDDLGAVGHWEGHPEDQNELEDVVECWCCVSR
jgi:hypothetical protein